MPGVNEPLKCPSCGQPVTLAADGQSIRVIQTFVQDDDGTMTLESIRAGWCPTCVEEWNQRVA